MKSPALSSFLAQHRFGFGAEPGAGDRRGDARDGLRAALDAPIAPIFSTLPNSESALAEVLRYRKLNAEQREAERAAFQERQREVYGAEIRARLTAALDGHSAFRERLVWFWSNHFTVSIQKGQMQGLVGPFEREAIRPHVAGRFADMLQAVVRHPAMLIYLDNAVSIGPESRAGERTHRGLNENLARELMELHTLGVDGGYGQDDVIALARILTGWSVAGSGAESGANGSFRFYPMRHEPGPKRLLGRAYQSDDGYSEGVAALNDLAVHPATARHVARKLATHFLSDDPDAAAIVKLERRFLDTGGDLAAVSRTLIELDAAARPELTKLRPPGEFLVAALKIVGGEHGASYIAESKFALVGALRVMGQPAFGAPSPKGWSDQSGDWSGPDAVFQRISIAHAVARRIALDVSAQDRARAIFGGALSDETGTVLRRAPSAADGAALLLAAPEVQRR